MITLTADQLADLRQDIDDDGTPPAFSDAQLNRNYVRAGGNYDLTVVYTLRQLLASNARMHAYSMGQSSESLDQVYEHVKGLLAMWERVAGAEGGALQPGVLALGLDEGVAESEEWA